MLSCQSANLNCTLSNYSHYPWNCTEHQSCQEQADNDIAGLGVLLAFMVASSATLVIAWVGYIVRPVDVSLENKLSILDQHFLEWFWKCAGRPPKMSSRWARVLQKAILHLSDSHIVTGLAILTAGFIQFCRISIYHFHFVVYLAWLASSTHMTTLTVLRNQLRRHRPILKWRVIAMTGMFIMLFIALALTASRVWPGNYHSSSSGRLFFDSPVSCAWKQDYMKVWERDTVFSVCLMTAGYLTRLSKLFISTSDFFRLWLRDRPSSWLKHKYDVAERYARAPSNAAARFYWKSLATFILGIYVDARSFYDLYESLLSELIWLSFTLLWGFSKILTWRMNAPVRAYEDKWGFGQLLPLLLLLLPVVAVPELYAESKHPDWANDVESTRDQANPSTAHRELHRSPTPQSNVQVEIGDSLVPVDGETRAGTRRFDVTSRSDDGSYLLRSISDAPFLQSNSYDSSSAQQPDKITRPLLLTAPDFPYGSKSFKFLIFLNVSMVGVPFVMMLTFMWAGDNRAGALFLEPTMFSVAGLPIVLGPRVIWFVLMMPYSHVTKR